MSFFPASTFRRRWIFCSRSGSSSMSAPAKCFLPRRPFLREAWRSTVPDDHSKPPWVELYVTLVKVSFKSKRFKRQQPQAVHSRPSSPRANRPTRNTVSTNPIPQTVLRSPYPPSRQTNLVEYNPDHQAAARAHANVLAVPQVRQPDLEAVAARARVVVDLELLVVGHVLDFDLVVERLGHGFGRWWSVPCAAGGESGCGWFGGEGGRGLRGAKVLKGRAKKSGPERKRGQVGMWVCKDVADVLASGGGLRRW